MSRNVPHDDLEFGCESFLDVTTNIVGILIVLMVFAGMRMARHPNIPPEIIAKAIAVADAADLANASKTTGEVPALPTVESEVSAPTLPTVPILPSASMESPNTPEDPEIELPVPAPLPEIIKQDPTPRQLAEQQALRQVVAKLAAENEEWRTRLARLEQFTDQTATQTEEARNLLSHRQQVLRRKQDRIQEQQAAIEEARAKLQRLSQIAFDAEENPENVQTIKHEVTPMSRIVSGPEKHFRLEKNRVAEVPIDDLVAGLKEQMDRRRDWFAKSAKGHGEVGPFNGFVMKYTVERENAGVLAELEMGPGVYRASVTQWIVMPKGNVPDETAEEALRNGSKFYNSLVRAAPDTNLTFWVYPDSFEIFRALQKFAHERGFTVAGRPLPQGVPIAGSPSGSRSSGQ